MLKRLRIFAAWLGFVGGIALLVQGMSIADTSLWRLILLTSVLMISLLPRAYLSTSVPVGQRALLRLALVFSLGFCAVGLQLVREQWVQAAALRTRAVAVLQPPQTAKPDEATGIRPGDRTALGTNRVWPVVVPTVARGTIVDRNGIPLAIDQGGMRVYPNPDVGHIVGFASALYGTSGIEGSFDSYLSGARTVSPTALLQARLLGTQPPPPRAADVRLSLDSTLQEVAQDALGERRGAVVLMDPQTGAILALASYPRFDPNQLVLPANATQNDVDRVQAAYAAITQQEGSPLLDRATQGRYPPGSIIKTFTAAAALDAGAIAGPEGRITCPNRLQTEVGAPPVVNSVENLARRTGDPSDLRRVFAFSCNTAFAQIGLALGADRFRDYAGRFGLGFVDAPLESPLRDISASAGTIANDGAFLDRQVALADTSFGQGQALLTPLDMAQMVAVIGNDGKLMRPYLVEDATANGQTLYHVQPETLRQVISPAAAQQMRSVMQTSVQIGYAAPVALPGVTIGAKTGTAETPSGAPHGWFVALAPLEQPRFAIAVIVENGGEGSSSALPVAKRVLAAAFGVTQ